MKIDWGKNKTLTIALLVAVLLLILEVLKLRNMLHGPNGLETVLLSVLIVGGLYIIIRAAVGAKRRKTCAGKAECEPAAAVREFTPEEQECIKYLQSKIRRRKIISTVLLGIMIVVSLIVNERYLRFVFILLVLMFIATVFAWSTKLKSVNTGTDRTAGPMDEDPHRQPETQNEKGKKK